MMATLTHTTTGWCGTASHPREDHVLRSSCIAFISDEDNTRLLLEEARLHDARMMGETVEARYVREYRPY